MHQIIADTVYLIERNSDGEYEIQGEHALSDLNTVPNVGDRITLTINDHGVTSIAEVVSRHLLRHLDRESDTEWTAWFLVVQMIEVREADELFEVALAHFDRFVRLGPRVPFKRRRRAEQP